MNTRLNKQFIPRFCKNILKRGFDCLTWDPWASRSWSQEGEDMVLRCLIGNKQNGFYVDVGAHHPKRFSNTYHFYRVGWRGINIDAMPGCMKIFNKMRPRDINLEFGVAQNSEVLNYYIFNEPALNGFSSALSIERSQKRNQYCLEKVVQVSVKPLREILKDHLAGREIDFLSVDVEGFDLNVLKSNDWTRYRPRYVLAEILEMNYEECANEPLVSFMKSQGYAFIAKQVNTAYFEDQSNQTAKQL